MKHTGARVTPEAAVFTRDGRMIYRGWIDDLYVDFGRMRAAPTQRDLEEALEALAVRRKIAITTTPAVGCFIPER